MSSDEELNDDWVPYGKRPDWADVVPLAQDDGDHPIVQIAYSDKFRDVFDYFRAVVATREKSERALELTNDALKLNPANYTVWQYRRDILRELKLDMVRELDYCEAVIVNNPKNYQVWHHRRCICEFLGDASRELQLTAEVLDLDAKNYHAWQHRQWAIKTYGLFDDELVYVDTLISQDVRNNSAWNQRFFVLKYTGLGPEVLQRECKYAMTRIRLVKNNESSWSFLRGLLAAGEGRLDQFAEVVEFSEDLLAQGCHSPHLIAFLIDLYEERCLRPLDAAAENLAAERDARNHMAEKVITLCSDMQNKYDVIREKYWQYVAFNFRVQNERVKGTFGQVAPATTTTAAADEPKGAAPPAKPVTPEDLV